MDALASVAPAFWLGWVAGLSVLTAGFIFLHYIHDLIWRPPFKFRIPSDQDIASMPMTDDDQILICAFRYSLGRMTYIVSDCSRWIRERWSSISEDARSIIRKELHEAIQRDDRYYTRTGDNSMHLGSSMDAKHWQELYLWMEQQ